LTAGTPQCRELHMLNLRLRRHVKRDSDRNALAPETEQAGTGH